MNAISNLFRRKAPKEPWPLRFDNYSFGTRCFNTLRCSIVYANTEFVLDRERHDPSGEPERPDWKDHLRAGFGTLDFESRGFPTKVEVWWTALDGVEREVEIDLEEVFPGHVILHNVPREDIDEHWAAYDRHIANIYLVVNDRTITVYMSAFVLTKHPVPDDPELKQSRRDLVQVWSKTY